MKPTHDDMYYKLKGYKLLTITSGGYDAVVRHFLIKGDDTLKFNKNAYFRLKDGTVVTALKGDQFTSALLSTISIG